MPFSVKNDTPVTSVAAADKFLFGDISADGFDTITAENLLETLATVTNDVAGVRTALAVAPLASPTFTGTPAAPTAAAGTNTTQVATTAFVRTAIDGRGLLVTDHGVLNDGRYTTGSATNGQPVVLSASFVAGDVGKLVTVPYAGLNGIVQSVVEGVSATLNANAQATAGTGTPIWIGTDNTTPLQTLATAAGVGAELVFPVGKYLFNGEITFLQCQKIRGMGFGYKDDMITGGTNSATMLIQCKRDTGNFLSWPSNMRGGGLARMALYCPYSGNNFDPGSTQTAVNPGFFGKYFTIDDVNITHFGRGVATAFTDNFLMRGGNVSECYNFGVQLSGGSILGIYGTLLANCVNGNLKVDNAAAGVQYHAPVLDESGNTNIWIENAYRVDIQIAQMFTATTGADKHTIRIGNSGGTGVVQDVLLRIGKIEPYNPGASSGGTVIRIYSGAVRTNLGCGTPILATANSGGTVLTDGGTGTLGSVTTI